MKKKMYNLLSQGFKYSLLTGLLLSLLWLTACGTTTSTIENFNGQMKVYFLDVGQGDSILIQTAEKENILIDAGGRDAAETVVKDLKDKGVKSLEAVIATHPHEDHIGGMVAVLKEFPVKKFYMPKATANTRVFTDLLKTLKAQKIPVQTVQAKDTLPLQKVTAVFLSPQGKKYEDLNNYSAVLKVTDRKNSFLFMGDAESLAENEILKAGFNVQAQVLKVGHHGSKSSTNTTFLKAVKPTYAVISLGKNNDYGHPHSQTLKKLAKYQVEVYRTDQKGTILIVSDGEKIEAAMEP
jgi:competence protein ComEC